MRENRLYGSEGGGALTRSPYPHRGQCPDAPLDPSRQPLALLEDARDVKVPGVAGLAGMERDPTR
jgi:hypothetical protein